MVPRRRKSSHHARRRQGGGHHHSYALRALPGPRRHPPRLAHPNPHRTLRHAEPHSIPPPGLPSLSGVCSRTSPRLRSSIRRIRAASFSSRTLAFVQSHASALDAATGRLTPQTYTPDAVGVVADAWHRDAPDPGRCRRSTARTDDPLLPGRSRSHPCAGFPLSTSARVTKPVLIEISVSLSSHLS